ncbi:Ribonuclease H-like domain [Phytophthora cactorum]|nr:Ribonuclease H-like domain [Phytophthora cactorum]
MATNNPFSPRQVYSYFFKVILDDQDEPTAHFRCQCSFVRKQTPKTGYSNLFDHVLKQHPDFVATMLASGTNTTTLVSFIDQKSQTVFCWLDWTTACNLPFTWRENATVAKYTNLANISTETLLKYAGLVVREVEIDIGLALPVKFGITFDGWTFLSEHYLAAFAVFEHDGRADKVLLAFAPLIDDEVTDHSAVSHVKFLEGRLPFFDRDIADIVYLVGDICAVNTKLSDLLTIPLVGSASHRLNLAVQRFMADHDFLLNKIQDLMRKLRNLNHSAKLRKKHYFETCSAPSYSLGLNVQDENKLRLLLDDLRAFKSASKKLQSDEKVTLLDVRDLFETLIERHPSDAEHLAANASVVKNPAFENACVKVLLGKEMELTGNDHELLAAFATPVSSRPSNDEDDSDDRDGFADLCVRASAAE